RVLAPSRIMADKLTGLGVRNVFVQPLGVDLQTFNPDARDSGLRAELGLDENARLLIFAGRGSKEKNLPVLLDCMKRLGRRYHLLLVGSSMPTAVPSNVTVIDEFCPAVQVARLMASADALLHAGDQETFGLVLLEAMASGIPVVAVEAGAFEEIVTNDCGVLCAPNNPAAMATAVRELFGSGSVALGRQARLHVERHYAWDTVVNSLLQHYHAVLGSQWPLTANG
ncbi:MAG: glycosyltransferase, partial [Pseudomonas fluorescens]|nr:glycosyltransferase [Pseudomonas fluorescens]